MLVFKDFHLSSNSQHTVSYYGGACPFGGAGGGAMNALIIFSKTKVAIADLDNTCLGSAVAHTHLYLSYKQVLQIFYILVPEVVIQAGAGPESCGTYHMYPAISGDHTI